MPAPQPDVLLMDFCGAEPVLALMRGDALLGSEILPERGAAAGWLPALQRLLQQQNMALADLAAVGVVAGPGSFTGVRIGLAAAKGLCEGRGLPLIAVSRLAVLAHAAEDTNAVAALYAGRGQVYVRIPSDHTSAEEVLADINALEVLIERRPLVIAEPQLAGSLSMYSPRLVRVEPKQILPLVLQALHHEPELPSSDANYVRREADIYQRPASAPGNEAS